MYVLLISKARKDNMAEAEQQGLSNVRFATGDVGVVENVEMRLGRVPFARLHELIFQMKLRMLALLRTLRW